MEPIVTPPEIAAAAAAGNQLSEGARRRRFGQSSCEFPPFPRDPAYNRVGIRHRWASAAEAAAYFKSRPMFKSWDHAVLDAFLQGAISVDPLTGACALKCDPQAEAKLYEGTLVRALGFAAYRGR